MKTYYLPSYNEGLEMIKSNPEMCFYMLEHEIDGFNISMMNYKLVTYDKFVTPVENKPYNAYEMRGLTFVFNEDNTLFKRYLLLPKFFNLNQVDETQYNLVKDKKIKSIYLKEDGSITSFIKLPNGKVVCRSKMSVYSNQALASMDIYNTNISIKKLVDWSLDNDIVLTFEYVSPFNRIVLSYPKDELILLRARNNKTGELIDLSDLPSNLLKGVRMPDKINSTLDELIELAKTIEGIEGWVVEFEDGTMLKVKTEWYCVRHHIMTDCLNRENDLVNLILNEKIDDLISNLGESESDMVARKRIDIISKLVLSHISNAILDINNTFNKYWTGSVKDLALSAKSEKNFYFLMMKANGKDLYTVYKEHLLKKTYRLESCREFLYKLGLKEKINE